MHLLYVSLECVDERTPVFAGGLLGKIDGTVPVEINEGYIETHASLEKCQIYYSSVLFYYEIAEIELLHAALPFPLALDVIYRHYLTFFSISIISMLVLFFIYFKLLHLLYTLSMVLFPHPVTFFSADIYSSNI